MIRLTFRENDKFGVVEMNEENQDKKLYACVLKLLDYEDTGLSPNDISKLKEENDSYNQTMKYLNKLRDENNQLKQQLKEEKEFTEQYRKECANIQSKNIEFQQQLAEKDKVIEDLKQWKEWYSMRYKNSQKQIEDLTTELETYRPTKLHGNGQCECFKCKQEGRQLRFWTDWCSKYKGHIYCDDCLKEILKEEQIKELKNNKKD